MSTNVMKIRSSDNTILCVCIFASVLLHACLLLIERPVTFAKRIRSRPVVMTMRLETRTAEPRLHNPVLPDTATVAHRRQAKPEPQKKPAPVPKPVTRTVKPPERSRPVQISDPAPAPEAPSRSRVKQPIRPAPVPKKKKPEADTVPGYSPPPPAKLSPKYHLIVKSRIVRNIPDFPEEWDFSATVDVRIYINKDGSVKKITFLSRSRNYFLNQAIKYAVKKSAPFPPLDPRLSISHLPVNYRFIKK